MMGSRLVISRPHPYLRITSRSDDVLPPLLRWLSMSSGISKRALPSRVERPFCVCVSSRGFYLPFWPQRAPGFQKRNGREGGGMNRSLIGPPADAYAQPLPALSRPLVLRRAVSPACPSQQGCSAAVASVRPFGGPGGVFEKNEDRKGWQGAGPEPSRQGQILCRSSRLTHAL